MLLPGWIAAALRWGSLALTGVFAIAAVFAALVMPYRFWDSLAFGSWSRLIAEGADLWSGVPALFLQRPLFYVEQGLVWRVLGWHEWIGRLLSLSFALALVVVVWLLARRLTTDDDAQVILPPLAATLVVASSVFATYALAGMTDVPVAAMVAATGVALWTERFGYGRTVVVAVLAAGTVLTKPTGILGLLGLAVAVLILNGRGRLLGLAGLAAGVGVALLYDVWQSSRIGAGLTEVLTAGNDAFWLERGKAARWGAIAEAELLGVGIRLVVLFGLVHALARVAGARPRLALGIAAGVAIGWSIIGPGAADGNRPYPFDGSVPGIAAWIMLALAMIVAPLVAVADPVSRRTYAALLAWLAPMAVAWVWQRADDVRLLAPVWAPLVLLAASGIASLMLALARLRPAWALMPAVAVALVALANLPSVDGLGRDGWRDLLELGPSRWTSRAERENFAYGPFSYELNAARENVGENDRIVSSSGPLAYFFPGRVEFHYATSCGELEGARFFSFLRSGESLEFAERLGQTTDPLAWLQCTRPPLTLVAEHEGIYAAFVVGDPPARAPTPADCRIASTPGQDFDAVFGDGLTYAEAKALRERAFAIGYTGGLKLERTGCSTFRVVVAGVPDDEGVQTRFERDARKLGFDVTYAPANRFPEVPPDVAAVP